MSSATKIRGVGGKHKLFATDTNLQIFVYLFDSMSVWGASALKRSKQKQIGPKSIARVYADVNQHRAKEYWDYEALNITYGFGRETKGFF